MHDCKTDDFDSHYSITISVWFISSEVNIYPLLQFGLTPFPNFRGLRTKSCQTAKFMITWLIINMFINIIFINIIIKYQLITLSGISKNIRQGVLSCCFYRSNQKRVRPRPEISPPSFCFSLLSLLSLPWPSSDRCRETKKREKKTNLSKKQFLS